MCFDGLVGNDLRNFMYPKQTMVKEGDLDSVKNWLQQSDENLNKPILNDMTVLHLACIAKKLEIVEELLNAGASKS